MREHCSQSEAPKSISRVSQGKHPVSRNAPAEGRRRSTPGGPLPQPHARRRIYSPPTAQHGAGEEPGWGLPIPLRLAAPDAAVAAAAAAARGVSAATARGEGEEQREEPPEPPLQGTPPSAPPLAPQLLQQ